MKAKTKKVTFNLPEDVLNSLDEIMEQGIAASKNALVEQALKEELKRIKKELRRKAWEEAAKDPLLIRDITEIENDFRYADAESARRIV